MTFRQEQSLRHLNPAFRYELCWAWLPVCMPSEGLVEVLCEMRAWVDEIPPQKQLLRYGNPPFR